MSSVCFLSSNNMLPGALRGTSGRWLSAAPAAARLARRLPWLGQARNTLGQLSCCAALLSCTRHCEAQIFEALKAGQRRARHLKAPPASTPYREERTDARCSRQRVGGPPPLLGQRLGPLLEQASAAACSNYNVQVVTCGKYSFSGYSSVDSMNRLG